MAEVVLTEVGKVYEDGTEAVRNLCLEALDGELIVLVGPSGCGKTTALRMIAGLEEITSGTIRIGSRTVNDVHPARRDIAMVFQNYALYPHMTVGENIGFPLKLAGVRKGQRHVQVLRMAKTLGLETHLNKRPRQLSGGQRQRVAMGRAIVREPKVFLMDEPLSNLDAKLRVQMRGEIAALQRELAITTIYVTHDQVEAMTMADRVAVMRRGELQQLGPPQDVYAAPTNLFVAGFIGSPPMNLIEVEVTFNPGRSSVRFGTSELEIAPDELARQPGLQAYGGQRVVLGVRPEKLEDAALRAAVPGRTFKGKVVAREPLGSDVLVHFSVEGLQLSAELVALSHDVEDPTELETVGTADPEAVLTGRFDPASRAAPPGEVTVSVRPGALQFFDRASGAAI